MRSALTATRSEPKGGRVAEQTPDPKSVTAVPLDPKSVTEPPDPKSVTAVPLAFQLGWTMAVLYRVDPAADAAPTQPLKLPSEHELRGRAKLDLEMTRLTSLIDQLGGTGAPYANTFKPGTAVLTPWMTPPNPAPAPPNPAPAAPKPAPAAAPISVPAAPDPPSPPPAAPNLAPAAPPSDRAALQRALIELNLSILENLIPCGGPVQVAYQAGRSLRDTVDPPGDTDTGAFVSAFDRSRIATMQEWLSTLSTFFPLVSAQVVSVSIGRWADQVGVTLGDLPGALKGGQDKDKAAADMRPALFRQGDVWLALLTGGENAENLLSPEGYVAAGEAALSRTGRIVTSVLRHYWVAVVLVVAALGGILTLSALYLGGASRVWTSIAAIAGTLGISWKGIGAAIPKLAEHAEAPIYRLEKVDAIAWAITALPTSSVTSLGVHTLRQAGILKGAPLGRS